MKKIKTKLQKYYCYKIKVNILILGYLVSPRLSKGSCSMVHVIAEPCLDTKDTACVDVCPVDCIHEAGDGSSNQLFIDPVECIDCAACVPACPVDAIFAEGDLPTKWSSFTKINSDFFTAEPVVASASSSSSTESKKAAAKEPEWKPEPIDLAEEDMYKSISEMRDDVAANRGFSSLHSKNSFFRIPVITIAALLLLFVYGLSNNLSKNFNKTIYGKISLFALSQTKPKIAKNTLTIFKKINGKTYKAKVVDSIFGSRNLSFVIPSSKFKKEIYHAGEAYFGKLTNQNSLFYYIYTDEKSDGKLDSVLLVREIWSSKNRFLGRYHRPVKPTSEHQSSYKKAAELFAKEIGIIQS